MPHDFLSWINPAKIKKLRLVPAKKYPFDFEKRLIIWVILVLHTMYLTYICDYDYEYTVEYRVKSSEKTATAKKEENYQVFHISFSGEK